MDDSELADIKAAIMDQWRSMAGMGAMFVSSILFGVFIQPFYNFEEMRAFGEEGTTEAGNILFELFMIFLFTIAVIWLARKGKEVVIKTIVFLALGYSLLLAVMPVLAILDYLLGLDSGPTLFSLICLGVAGGMMYTLHRYPEWYVVNTVGVLVGSGVIVMLGIAFVPVLIILFMVLAAIYDHWAVNGSKHMLELADTMIDLKLPVLLVAPKDTSYTFLKQDGDIREGTEPRPVAPPEGCRDGDDEAQAEGRALHGPGGRHIPGHAGDLLDHIPTRDRPSRVRLLGGPLQARPPGPDAGRHGDPVRGPARIRRADDPGREGQAPGGAPAPERREHTGLPRLRRHRHRGGEPLAGHNVLSDPLPMI